MLHYHCHLCYHYDVIDIVLVYIFFLYYRLLIFLVLIDHLMMQYAQCDLLGREDYSFVRDGNMATLYDAQAREVAATQASKAGMSAKKMQEEYEEN